MAKAVTQQIKMGSSNRTALSSILADTKSKSPSPSMSTWRTVCARFALTVTVTELPKSTTLLFTPVVELYTNLLVLR